MTTIQDLPEEVLREIFRQLGYDDPPYCQQVCRSWYMPAHLQVLEKIVLNTIDDIKKFIRSINYNPNSTYLRAVKIVDCAKLVGDDSFDRIAKRHLTKLFCRFPNLHTIVLTVPMHVLDFFNDKFCKTVLKSCPKLTKFQVTAFEEVGTPGYYHRLRNVRSLLTNMEIEEIDTIPGYDSLVDYIVSFPRLSEIDSFKTPLDKFEAYLPVFMRLPHLTDFSITQASADQQGFAEGYLEMLTNEEHHQLLNQLSKISYLSWTRKLSFCENAAKFIAKYMTGLKRIKLSTFLNRSSNNAQQRLFFDTTLDLTRTVNDCCLSMATSANILSDYLPLALQKVFHQTAPIRRLTRTLQLSMGNVDFYPEIVNFHINTNQATLKREISAFFRKSFSLTEATGYLFKENAKFEDVDKFLLIISTRRDPFAKFKVSLKMYYDILASLPALKQLKLDIPQTFIDTEPKQLVKLSQLEALTLQATPTAKFQTLLGNFSQAFPNLKTLDLCYFCGIWEESTDEFQLKLDGYSLEKLIVDMTPFKIKMDEGPKGYDEFFVVQVYLLSINARRFYIVHWGLSDIASIDESDLQSITCKEDAYITVHITVSSLQCLKLCMYNETPEDGFHDYLEESQKMEYATLFKE